MFRVGSALICLFLWIPLISSLEYLVSDISGLGRRFDGIGGLSGGGATSKLLVNYPEQQRNEILDFLFKPNYGASLHILKVEIGGDAQSTDGTESSHMHESWDENFRRGYEWWLLTEAKKRNPEILLYVLPWTFPGWVGQGTSSPYTAPNVTADYVTRFISGASSVYGLTIDYVGIWNERPYDVTYVKTLRQTLDSRGLSNVQIVAPDGQWDITKDVLADSDFAKAIDFLGAHYPGTFTTYDALRTGKQLWASEDYSTYNDNTGAGCWARILNQNYVNGMMTATISWNLIASYYSNLPFYRDGLMTAIEPWGGNYVVEAPIWVSAHTTQFTKPGWRYLLHSSGVGKLQGGGSFVSFTDPGSSPTSLTIVIETMSHDHSLCIRPALPKYSVVPQNVLFKLEGSFANVSSLNVWYSKLQFDGSNNTLFEKRSPIQVVNGEVVLSLGVDEMYTLTTVMTGAKGTAPDPPSSMPFPLPYSDDFDNYAESSEPDNLAQQIGVWEAAQVGAPHHGVIRQVVLQEPVKWCAAEDAGRTFNLIGNPNWTDIYIKSDVRIPSLNGSKGVFVAVRVNQGGCNSADAAGVFFIIYPGSQSYSVVNDLGGKQVLKTGSAKINSDWNSISLLIRENNIIGSLNGQTAFSQVAPEKPQQGFVALGTDGYGLAEFDNLAILGADEGWERTRNAKQRDADTLYFRPRGRH